MKASGTLTPCLQLPWRTARAPPNPPGCLPRDRCTCHTQRSIQHEPLSQTGAAHRQPRPPHAYPAPCPAPRQCWRGPPPTHLQPCPSHSCLIPCPAPCPCSGGPPPGACSAAQPGCPCVWCGVRIVRWVRRGEGREQPSCCMHHTLIVGCPCGGQVWDVSWAGG